MLSFFIMAAAIAGSSRQYHTYRLRSAVADVGEALDFDAILLEQLPKSLAWWESLALVSIYDPNISNLSDVAQEDPAAYEMISTVAAGFSGGGIDQLRRAMRLTCCQC